MPEHKRPRVIRGRDVKKSRTYLLQVRPGVWFRMHRVDIVGLVFEGIVPTPLLRAVDKVQNLKRSMQNDESISDALESITSEEREQFTELMRRCAVRAVMDPKLTHSRQASLANEDLLWVGGISDVPGDTDKSCDGDVSNGELMEIWKAVLGEAGAVTISDIDAEEFRPSEPLADAPLVRDGERLRTEAVVLVPDAGDQTLAASREIDGVYH